MNQPENKCDKCGTFLTLYEEKVIWEIKWNPNHNLFVFSIYVEEKDKIRIYRDLIPNHIINSWMFNTEQLNRFVKERIDSIINKSS